MKTNSRKSSLCNLTVSDDIKIPPLDQFKLLNFPQRCKRKFKFIFQNIHQNNRFRVKNCSHVLQINYFLDLFSCELR